MFFIVHQEENIMYKINSNSLSFMTGIVSAASIAEASHAAILFSKKEVRANNFDRAKKQFDELRKAGIKAAQKLSIFFDGYDDDSREIWQIPETRAFVARIFSEYPEFLFYLNDKTKNPIICCLMNIKRSIKNGHGNTQIEIPITNENNRILLKLFAEAHSYYLKLK